MDITTNIGVFGASVVLLGFILNQFNVLSTQSRRYDILNIVGPVVLVVYALMLSSMPFVILNVVWALTSACSLYKSFAVVKVGTTKLSE